LGGVNNRLGGFVSQSVTVVPLVISCCALLVSLIGLLYTARNYAASHRPYIGVVDTPFHLGENPPRAIVWKVVVKNVGTVPGFVVIAENTATLSNHAGSSMLPSLGAFGKTGTLLMPGQIVELLGQYSEVGGPVPMADILSGQATLELAIRMTYEFSSWLWPSKREYAATLRFHVVKGVEPGFAMIGASAN
jgi:hypothetical protein